MNHHPNRSTTLSRFHARSLFTTPLAIALLLFHSLGNELVKARHIANIHYSLTEIQALPSAPEAVVAPTDPTAPLVINHQPATNRSLVSDERRAEVMAEAAQAQYHFQPDANTPGSATAANPKQRLDLVHTATGLTVTPLPAPRSSLDPPAAAPDWSVRFQTISMSLDSTSIPLDSALASNFENQSSTDLAPGCNEWFINRDTGVKHGYTIQEPIGDLPATLAVRIDVTTKLTPVYDAATQGIEFYDQNDRSVLAYRGLHVYDQLGRALPSTMSLDGSTIILSTDVHDAVYPVTIDPDVTATQQGLSRMASDGAANDGFGTATAGHGDFNSIGAQHNGNGKVYIQHRDQGGTDAWGEQACVEVPAGQGGGTTDRFGAALAMGEDPSTGNPILAVGAPEHGGCGAVFIFIYVLGVWTFLQKIVPAALTGGDLFGCSLAFFGVLLAVGARAHLGHGAVFLLALGLILFALVQTILSPVSTLGHDFGAALAFFGLFLLVGAPGATIGGFLRAGAAYLFTALVIGGLFALNALQFFSAHPAANDEAGTSVAVNRDSVAIGIPYADGWPGSGLTDSGLVLIFALVAGVWGHRASLFGLIALALFGFAMSMNFFGDIAIGSPNAKSAPLIIAGLIFLFIFNAITKTYPSTGEKIQASGFTHSGMFFGAAVLLLGTILFVMASRYNGSQGAFFLFFLAATALTFLAWQLLFWPQVDIDNPAMQHIVGPQGDASGDGIPNFVKFAMNLIPTIFNANPLLGIIAAGGLYTLVFPISLVALNAIFILQYTLGLATWYNFGAGPLLALLSMSIRYPGIAANLMVLTLAVAVAAAISGNVFFRFRADPMEQPL